MMRLALLSFLLLPLIVLGQKKATPEPGFTAKSPVCVGDTVQFTNTANTNNVLYNFGDGLGDKSETRSENPRHPFDKPGTYLVVQTANLDGTSATWEMTIVVKAGPDVTLTYSQTGASNDTVRMFTGQNVTVTVAESFPDYRWYIQGDNAAWQMLAEGDPSYTTNLKGAYKVQVSSTDGCPGEAPFWIETTPRPDDFDLINIVVKNNVLTPNNDGVNDVFFIKDLGNPDIYQYPVQLYIYNRGGVLVYQNENYANEWDGKDSSGTELSTGTYYFIAKSEKRRGKTGFIDIIRSE